MATILKMMNICKSFPGVRALDQVSLTLKKGEILGLVGENGAGKSTLIKILAGAYQSDSGKIEIDGQEVADITPCHMINRGVAVIYQEFMLSPHMTVAENVFLGRIPKNAYGMVDYRAMEQQTAKICAQLGLELDPQAKIGELSVAKRQMVEIAKALSRNAKIIVLDEPTAVLGENELKGMFDIIRKLAREGVSFIYISHRLKEIFELVDTVTVMKDGKVVVTDAIDRFNIDLLVKSMVGRELKDIYPKRARSSGKEVLKVTNLTRKGVLDNINFTLHQGEILAISGLAGAGRSEILKAIIGAAPGESGEIEVFGKKVAAITPKNLIRLGMGLLPEERKVEGLFLRQSLIFNVTIAKFQALLKFGLLMLGKERAKAGEYIAKMNIRPGNPEIITKNLSGGNQQKVVFSRWLNAQCKILLVDEPTRGVDVGAKQEIYKILAELVQEGMAVLIVSSELPEVLGISDRVMVIWQGKKVAELNTATTTEEEIMMYATGQKLA